MPTCVRCVGSLCVLQVDCNKAGCIVDDELYETLVVPLPEGCELTVLLDCCHAGIDAVYQLYVHTS
jgi:Caspase domain